jgi:hypothetical protein
MWHIKLLEKQEKTKTKISRGEIIKIRAKINEIETKKTIQRINKTKSQFFRKRETIEKLLANMTKMGIIKSKMKRSRKQQYGNPENYWGLL